MLFKVPVLLAAVGFFGLAASTPIVGVSNNGLQVRQDGGSHGGGAGNRDSSSSDSGGGSSDSGSGGSGSGDKGGGSHGGGSGNNGSGGGSGGGSGSGGSGGGSGSGGGGNSNSSEIIDGQPGPSGQLLQPQGGFVLPTEVDWPGAGFRFIYKPVYQRNPDPNCVNQRQACYAATTWLSVSLFNIDTGDEYSLADFLHVDSDNPSANIDTWLGVPEEADCGNFRLRVIEHQRYFNRWVQFQSAAPQGRGQCLRYSGPGS